MRGLSEVEAHHEGKLEPETTAIGRAPHHSRSPFRTLVPGCAIPGKMRRDRDLRQPGGAFPPDR